MLDRGTLTEEGSDFHGSSPEQQRKHGGGAVESDRSSLGYHTRKQKMELTDLL